MKSICLFVCILLVVSCKRKNKNDIKMEQNRNKQIVTEFYRKVIGEQDLEFAKKIVTDDYIQHNPHVRTGKEGFLEAIEFLNKMPKPKNPPKPFMRVIADGEYVVVHLSVEFNEQKKIVLEIFRIENGLIAEHWDAIQDISGTGSKGNREIEGPIAIENEEATSKNKAIVRDFVEQVMIDRNFGILENYLATDLTLHDPKMNNGLKGFKKHYKKLKIQKVHRIIGQGNFVVTQSKGILDNENFAIYDIYRLKNGLISEHWSVSQKIPEEMAHGNGMI